jgi:hypothetical protein
MFETNTYHLNRPYSGMHAGNGGQQTARAALQLYRSACTRGWISRLWGSLTGRTSRLLDLKDVRCGCAVRGSHYAGTRAVPIDRIRGSEGRCEDFDGCFRPLRAHNRGRWMGIASLQLEGTTLPPVELVQVGDVYFVRDGHHRISVARALGQTDVDAEVTVLEVQGPLPWERQEATTRLAQQPA